MPLHTLFDQGIFDVVKVKETLEQSPFAIHVRRTRGHLFQTPLERVLRHKGHSIELVRLLLEYVPCASLCNKLYIAIICRNSIEIIELLAARAFPNQVGKEGKTVFHIMLGREDLQTGIIRALLDYPNMDVNCVDNNGSTLLHIACQNRYTSTSTVERLLDRGARLDVRDHLGATPFHLALMRRVGFKNNAFSSIIKLLLQKNPPMNSINNKGETILTTALRIRVDHRLINMFLMAGANMGDTYESRGAFLRSALWKFGLPPIHPSFKVLAKFSLLESRRVFDYVAEYSDRRDGYEELPGYLEECSSELEKMESKKIGLRCTVFKLAIGVTPCFYNLDRLLELRPDKEFPIYCDIISMRIGRSVMLNKLINTKIFLVKECPESSNIHQRVELNYDSVCALAKFLSDIELLKLLLAYHAPFGSGNRPVDECGSRQKRCCEESDFSTKHPRLDC